LPVKLGKKKYKSFGTAVGSLQKQGYSKESAQKIVGSIEAKQAGTYHKKRKKK
jgi:hypothetical protein